MNFALLGMVYAENGSGSGSTANETGISSIINNFLQSLRMASFMIGYVVVKKIRVDW